MTDVEKKAIEILECFEPDDLVECAMYRNALNQVKNLIEKQEKVIDEMAQEIYIEHEPHFITEEEVKQYFYKKAEEDKNE